MRSLLVRARTGAALTASRLRPQRWSASWQAARTLWLQYGHLRSVQTESAVDRTGHPVPWYTYPAIEYLRQFDFSDKRVFEWGSGNSTLFWAGRAAEVISVEDDERWYAMAEQRRPVNCTLQLEPDLRRYVAAIDAFPGGFDIIVVDGPARGRTRFKCATAALRHLRHGGLIILDNSDWLPESARLLRESGLLQVDMSGFIPIGGHTQTTSIFLHRACELRPIGGRQPQPSIGAVAKNWEPPIVEEGGKVEWEGEPIFGIARIVTFDKISPDAVRRFEVALRERAGQPPAFYLFDVAAQRVLLGPEPLDGRSFDEAVRTLEGMSWSAFCAYVRNSPMRRYLLDPVRSSDAA
jgi:hypothetical protein